TASTVKNRIFSNHVKRQDPRLAGYFPQSSSQSKTVNVIKANERAYPYGFSVKFVENTVKAVKTPRADISLLFSSTKSVKVICFSSFFFSISSAFDEVCFDLCFNSGIDYPSQHIDYF